MTDRSMPRQLLKSAPDFDCQFQAFMEEKRDHDRDVSATVEGIIADVRARGDAAVAELTHKFDGFDPLAIGFAIGEDEIASAVHGCPQETQEALALAAERIEAYHRRQMPEDLRYTDAAGVEIGHRWTPVDAVGLYVPGGKAAYPSSLLMNALPAKVAGVKRIVMTVPTPGGALNPIVLAAARLAGVTELYRVGGAQAVAALAFGVEVPPADVICGPGNRWVTAAKQLVSGRVGIDLLAGPSELLVIADDDADPEVVAADLIAQAEHDVDAVPWLVTPSAALADAVDEALARRLADLPTAETARTSLASNGGSVLVADLDEAVAVADQLAPEHLELLGERARGLAERLAHYGGLFVGTGSAEVFGDYGVGPNHTLPTGRTARYTGGLSVFTFLRVRTFLDLEEPAAETIADSVRLARLEGLEGHARSALARLKPR